MDIQGYSNEGADQILIALLKSNGIKRIIVSPGCTNYSFVASVQNDPFFKLYSCIDERSAAYMACGLSEESGEIVCLSCTGATASRNYFPALTEAYYRKLPILAVTSSQFSARIGQLVAQVTDRTDPPRDTVKYSVTLPVVRDKRDFWDCEVKVNTALFYLRKSGGGPVHINLQVDDACQFDVHALPMVRSIKRVTAFDAFPEIRRGKIAILIGSHSKMSDALIASIDLFCSIYDAVVFCDHTSGYYGKYKVLYSLVACQNVMIAAKPDLLIHIGEISGDYFSIKLRGETVWRVNEDGEVRDTMARLEYVFEMSEKVFFDKYNYMHIQEDGHKQYFDYCNNQLERLYKVTPELPFSNIWIASKTANEFPKGSVVHLGIITTLRSWNFYKFPEGVFSNANVGGFGIDGSLSSLVGASLVSSNRIYYMILGDLSFFYDMNVLGNRHIGNNIRILLINNGLGEEMKRNLVAIGEEANDFLAAKGHNGYKNQNLLKTFVKTLGFQYIFADSKESYLENMVLFTSKQIEHPIFFEVFTEDENEREALQIIRNLYQFL